MTLFRLLLLGGSRVMRKFAVKASAIFYSPTRFGGRLGPLAHSQFSPLWSKRRMKKRPPSIATLDSRCFRTVRSDCSCLSSEAAEAVSRALFR